MTYGDMSTSGGLGKQVVSPTSCARFPKTKKRNPRKRANAKIFKKKDEGEK
jgi:hypothetical protein